MNLIPSGVKQGSVTRRLNPDDFHAYRRSVKSPRLGDVVVVRVERLGLHAALEYRSGRHASLFAGDHLIGVIGSCHDPDTLEGVVPARLHRLQLLAASGVVGQVQVRNRRVGHPTELDVLGYVFDGEGKRVTLGRNRLRDRRARPVPTILVIGADRREGRSGFASGLVRTLFEADLRVGAARVTGTASRRAVLQLKDAGADAVVDFTAFGYPSTYHLPEEEVATLFTSIQGYLAGADVEIVVLELGHDLLQRETAMLLASDVVQEHVDAVVYCAGDVLNASAAHDLIVGGHRLPLLAVAGPVADSALSIRAVEDRTGIPCLASDENGRLILKQLLREVFPDLIQEAPPPDASLLVSE